MLDPAQLELPWPRTYTLACVPCAGQGYAYTKPKTLKGGNEHRGFQVRCKECDGEGKIVAPVTS
jgi:DnaJ-class molecular chaperone